jgi:hypothetical protein
MQKLKRDDEGHVRFVPNKIVRFLLTTNPNTLDDLAGMNFSRTDWAQFYQLIGYSVSGYCELSMVPDRYKDRAERRERKLRRSEKADSSAVPPTFTGATVVLVDHATNTCRLEMLPGCIADMALEDVRRAYVPMTMLHDFDPESWMPEMGMRLRVKR